MATALRRGRGRAARGASVRGGLCLNFDRLFQLCFQCVIGVVCGFLWPSFVTFFQCYYASAKSLHFHCHAMMITPAAAAIVGADEHQAWPQTFP
jgi:hypothetical protein